VQHGLLVLVLKQTVYDERASPGLDEVAWNVSDVDLDTGTGLGEQGRRHQQTLSSRTMHHGPTHLHSLSSTILLDPLPRPLIILELEDPGIVERQVLVRVPRASSERLQTPVSLETDLGRLMTGGVYLVGKVEVVGIVESSLAAVVFESVVTETRVSQLNNKLP
jgi:hypothetical protein